MADGRWQMADSTWQRAKNRLQIAKRIDEAEMLPRGYGVAYRDYVMHRAICYPIPLNWIVKWVRKLYFFVAIPRLSGLDKMLIDAMNRGFELGCTSERYQIDLRLTKEYARGWNAAFDAIERQMGKKASD